jgi:hypothetical protein
MATDCQRSSILVENIDGNASLIPAHRTFGAVSSILIWNSLPVRPAMLGSAHDKIGKENNEQSA